MKKGCWISLVVVVVLIVGGIVWGSIAKKNAPTPVTVATVDRGDFVHEVSGTGSIEAKVYTLGFTTPARVARVLVREHDVVPAGALLAELDLSKERESLTAARTGRLAQQAALRTQDAKASNDLRKLSADLREAERKLALAQRLYAAGAESADAVRDLQRSVDSLRGDQDTLRRTVQSQREEILTQLSQRDAEIRGYEQALRESVLRAPVAGTISQVDFRAGEVAQGAMKLVQAGSLKAKAQIQEAEAALLHPGMAAKIELDADPDHPLEAVIDELSVVATVKGEGGSATVPVKFRFPDPLAGKALPGYTITARVVTRRIANVLQVPLESLLEEKANGVRTYSIWVMTPTGPVKPKAPIKGTVAKTPVTVTARNLTKAVVEGLSQGAYVVTLPPDTLKAGDHVINLPEQGKEKK